MNLHESEKDSEELHHLTRGQISLNYNKYDTAPGITITKRTSSRGNMQLIYYSNCDVGGQSVDIE